jgi:hypothetical protein
MSTFQKQVDRVLDFLKINGKAIGRAAAEGNETANNIVKYYYMLSKCFDGMTFVMLESEVLRYAKLNALELNTGDE